MLLNIILIAVVVICLGIVFFLIVRKFPKLRTLDIETVPQAQTAKVRDRILLERMKRQTTKSKEAIKKGATPMFAWLKRKIKSGFGKIYDLEKKYQKEAEDKTPLKGKELQSKMNNLLLEATKLLKIENYSEAEKRFIEIVSLDPKNVIAYQGLADVYLAQKEYKQAMQTYLFILRLVKKKSSIVVKQTELGQQFKTISNVSEVADVHMDIGYLYQLMEKPEKAMEQYQKALESEPNNPRNLDQMIQLCLQLKNKRMAIEMSSRLEQVNPENQKLREYKDKIREM